MWASRNLFLTLTLLVVVWYLAGNLLPEWLGTCLDGECGFSPAEVGVSLLIPFGLVAIPIGAEMVLFKKGFAQALSDIGLTRFNPTALPIALLYLLPLIAFYPLFSLSTGNQLVLQPHWEWRLLGAVLNNGLSEETMMRGFVFRHVHEGRTFWRAAVLSTVYFAGYHLALIFILGPLIGLVSTLAAIPTGLFTAYLYERGEQTLWGPYLMHIGTNGLVFIFAFAPEIQPIAASLYLLIGIISSLSIVVWAYRSGFGRARVVVQARTASG